MMTAKRWTRSARAWLWAVAGVLALSLTNARASAPAGRYVMTDDTVFDTKTNLTWQRTIPAGTHDWTNAVSYCDGLKLANQTDWRLPTVKELLSIVDRRTSTPSIDPVAFPGTPSVGFWSSSVYAGDTANAWSVSFGAGYAFFEMMMGVDFRVRCVR